jgi:hypothetical protein
MKNSKSLVGMKCHTTAKLDQQRKTTSKNESSSPFKYNKSKEGVTSFEPTLKHVHSIDSDGFGPQENWQKNFRPPR